MRQFAGIAFGEAILGTHMITLPKPNFVSDMLAGCYCDTQGTDGSCAISQCSLGPIHYDFAPNIPAPIPFESPGTVRE